MNAKNCWEVKNCRALTDKCPAHPNGESGENSSKNDTETHNYYPTFDSRVFCELIKLQVLSQFAERRCRICNKRTYAALS